ncbi:PQQ-dependent sugar dehydrogenase [Mucilaginibacter sp. UR6-11]|uniref:PQQ-dependent sugar dehydrogenase n=1 Tax=Mucilaginibacter sp. UR6-11 TaxID=1435644 RepID=UPI001E4A793D|nr:PQQ-dependent sugar dehydrogenase [Mucilaginibacter sp. UR6-11]MCC8423940.1 PQQ-dependent sugar dehydrogenase [Mucilaginibacter sp. UR6-11]
MKKLKWLLAFCFAAFILSAFVTGKKSNTIIAADDTTGYKIDTLARDLVVPWQLVFLPDNSLLFTERNGKLRIYRNGHLVNKPVYIINDIPQRNKTGLLGLVLHPDFIHNHFVYMANNYWLGARMRLQVVRYEFRNDTLLKPFLITEDIHANQNHTGCRLVFGPDKKLYITTGDADEAILAQDLKTLNGKILRLNDDGTIPTDNPFFNNDTARKEIWSYGHRNPQGLVFEPGTNTLFDSEHGPTGGDEINIIKQGMNYGWPIIHHQLTREGMLSPLAEFTPSIGPSEAMFYKGDKFPQLKGKLLVACLRGESILKVTLDHDKIINQEVLLKKQYGRIRSLVTGPDGYIYFSTSQVDPAEGQPRPDYDMILRMRPSGSKGNLLSTQKIEANTVAQMVTVKMTTPMLIQQMCASCHGENLKGTDKGVNLVTVALKHGSTKQSIINTITNGVLDKGMPAWNGAISKVDIDKIAGYIIAKRKAIKE